jgi:hypothetical protein
MNFKAILATVLLFAGSIAHADTFAVGAGKLLNNVGHHNPTSDNLGQAAWSGQGYLVDLVYRHGPIQISATRVLDSYLGEELNVSAIARYSLTKRLAVGAGVIVSQSFKIPDWWFTSEAGQFGFGTSFSCQFCGEAVQLDYALSSRLELQVRYWATEKFVQPMHNGSLVLLSWRL